MKVSQRAAELRHLFQLDAIRILQHPQARYPSRDMISEASIDWRWKSLHDSCQSRRDGGELGDIAYASKQDFCHGECDMMLDNRSRWRGRQVGTSMMGDRRCSCGRNLESMCDDASATQVSLISCGDGSRPSTHGSAEIFFC